ncbi:MULTISPECIES: Lrp/AsnC family transcriptional regulator [Dyella]|uniref:Lrp/AsnC family transcriptional regulator n=2 Tax=Dyella TaxID=231454 RepID=A0A4R0YYC2_9GAMM|nr:MULTISPECIES: Lrp/AsnC family transcriptional regulator [Dyella]TBR40103.1 Lrp/AsnC family transcriptional regulator [Dyella terrae]TCI12314.1 Lrp/AsnC family transcriptional regulator [Dyella soli]
MTSELDKPDRRILAIIQKDARRSAELIGSDVGLSASAVQRRIVRMREEGVILAEVALVDPKQAGMPLTMIVDVEVERERPELLASLKLWIASEPCIQEAWYVTGAGDYVLIIVARDVEDFEALMQRMVTENANVRRFQTRVALSTLKRGMFVPLDPPAEPGMHASNALRRKKEASSPAINRSRRGRSL